MKKRISILLCMLVVILSFSGCASKKAEMDYDKASIEQVTEFLIDYCNEADEAMLEQWSSMSTFALEQQLTDAGLPFTPDSFLGALESWQSGVEECGTYIGHGEYSFEDKGKELLVTTEAEFKDRKADLEFVFNKNLYMDSLTVSAHYTNVEILEKAGLNTLLGMGTVFIVLIFISIIISLFKYIPALQKAFSSKPKTAETPIALPVKTVEKQEETIDNKELIAVIAAAIAAAEGTSTDGFVVRSIKRRKSNNWN